MSNFVVTKYPHGTFCWADLASTDVNQSKAFYTGLFGWETEDLPLGDYGFYTFLKKDGHHVAAMAQMLPDMQSQGIPSHWTNYVNVVDVDAVVAKAKELGATVIAEPMDIFDSGRMGVIQDPTGGNLGLWQAKNIIGATLVNTVGAMGWNELQTRDTAKAKEFYGKLLGWELETDDRDYTTIKNNGRYNGGIMEIMPEWGDVPAHWMPYFSVDKLEEYMEKAKSLGAKMVTDVMDIPDVGRFSVIVDPSGADFYIMQAGVVDSWVE